jgi:hypothetical protein
MKFDTTKEHRDSYKFWNIILLDETFKYVDDAKFLGYVGKNADPLSVQFCNFVQCPVFVNSVTSVK